MLGKNQRSVISRKKRISVLIISVFCLSCLSLTGCGGESEKSIYNFSKVESKDIDPWIYLQDTVLSSNSQIRSFASSASYLGITLGIMGIVFSILYMAIRILFSSNAKTKSEIKEEAFQKSITAIMIFSIPLWLGICKLIGELLI